MAVIDIQQFVGIAPRVPPRDMGAACAQACGNLLATAMEFRPLQEDAPARSDPAFAAARTLYRLSRDAQGNYLEDDAAGWIVAPDARSYAKGDLHDDATERTYFTFDDGTQAARVIDATGENRLLGVPAPVSVAVTVNQGHSFTLDDALTWVSATLIPAIVQALKASSTEYHIYHGAPVAGADAMYCLTWWAEDGGYGVAGVPADQAGALRDPSLAGFQQGGQWVVPILCFPKWGVVDTDKLTAALQAIEVPKAVGEDGAGGGATSFTGDQARTLAGKLAALFDPGGASIANLRQQMTAAVKDFCAAISAAASSAGASDPAPEVQPPQKPSVGGVFMYIHPDSDYGEGLTLTWNNGYRGMIQQQYPLASNPLMPQYLAEGDKNNALHQNTLCYEWWLYERQLDEYNAAQNAGAKQDGQNAQEAAALVARLAQDKAQAASVYDQICGEYQRRVAGITDLVTGLINGQSLLGEGGLIAVDADRIIDTRFYIATYVTDWGWESAPSPISAMLEVSQYDTVTVQVPKPPEDRQVLKWRIYRSNVGTQDAAYQFAADALAADGLSLTDQVKGQALGEVCPTFGWAEPPYRMDNASSQQVKPPKGDDPHLRGLVAMPNGILAGFIDNYVAFCDPYHPYAWPIEYQITTEAPIVGLGVFGQSLFVGTRGHPYVISGADSASMSAVKLPQLLPCVAARSIAGVGEGVIYASHDGLVLVSTAGAQLLTDAYYAREDWLALAPQTIRAIEYEGVYYFWAGDGVCRALDFRAKKLVTVDLPHATALRRDELTDALFAVRGPHVVRCFAQGRRTGRWKSGVQTFQKQAPLAWGVVLGDQSQAQPATLRWWGDGKLLVEKQVTGIAPFRLPAGRPLEHEVEIESAARITRVQLASSTAELQGI
ncbi:MAG: hypothetical protein LBI48_00740 [Burkholderiaceae bacterium]|nr:hypothetical protein [Burkholderiaceae bacterium]